jgi:SAM-dependent methyltransferase
LSCRDSKYAVYDKLLEQVTQSVRPSNNMITFYNLVGRLPLRMGALLPLISSIDAWKVIGHAGLCKRTDAAIRVLYQYRIRPWRLLWGAGDHLWQNSYNCRSVRSRGKLVEVTIEHLCARLVKKYVAQGSNEKPVIVSLGSGSAEQLLQGVCANGLAEFGAKVNLVDIDPRALKTAHYNACCLGVDTIVEIKKVTIGDYFNQTASGAVDLVEMVGLADYFNKDKMTNYLSEIYRVLQKDGFFTGANISSTEEYDYAHGAFCWPNMYYRTDEELRAMMQEAGFDDIWTGQCGLYTFWIAQK